MTRTQQLRKHVLAPLALAVFAMAFYFMKPTTAVPLAELMVQVPYFLLGLASAIALVTLHYYLVYTSVILLAYYYVIQTHLQVSLASLEVWTIFVSLILYWPIVTTLLLNVKARSIRSLRVILTLVIPTFILVVAQDSFTTKMAGLIVTLPDSFLVSIFRRSPVMVWMALVFICATVLSVLHYLRYPSYSTASVAMQSVLLLVMFSLFAEPFISVWTFMVIGALAVYASCQESYQLAYVDDLTQIPARKALKLELNNIGKRYSIAMVDIDHFKSFNDTHGHHFGDEVLKLVASHLATVRGGKAFRYGGEEFTLVFKGKTEAECLEELARLREKIEQYKIALRDEKRPLFNFLGRQKRGDETASETVQVTVSLGVAQSGTLVKSVDDVMKSADMALYQAKANGRNCVMPFSKAIPILVDRVSSQLAA